ncbi:uncharacterized protein BDR25DRAFT_357557 [Lindgomyces ingoldianus]|uniref:Uncharacterized protein n=1 Tax=Lindgomyces ingoldianus TaxID=673940 RepID=A0ACB6QNM7_9PLEO|nr:uncharacterized protein BDR25DRAFT_357557 [Lindgomyces ingoldianus]KAF2468619.1 hypothetical protein BDR25DRAFT_357557 [Lindgomyces ingoldianus]
MVAKSLSGIGTTLSNILGHEAARFVCPQEAAWGIQCYLVEIAGSPRVHRSCGLACLTASRRRSDTSNALMRPALTGPFVEEALMEPMKISRDELELSALFGGLFEHFRAVRLVRSIPFTGLISFTSRLGHLITIFYPDTSVRLSIHGVGDSYFALANDMLEFLSAETLSASKCSRASFLSDSDLLYFMFISNFDKNSCYYLLFRLTSIIATVMCGPVTVLSSLTFRLSQSGIPLLSSAAGNHTRARKRGVFLMQRMSHALLSYVGFSFLWLIPGKGRISSSLGLQSNMSRYHATYLVYPGARKSAPSQQPYISLCCDPDDHLPNFEEGASESVSVQFSDDEFPKIVPLVSDTDDDEYMPSESEDGRPNRKLDRIASVCPGMPAKLLPMKGVTQAPSLIWVRVSQRPRIQMYLYFHIDPRLGDWYARYQNLRKRTWTSNIPAERKELIATMYRELALARNYLINAGLWDGEIFYFGTGAPTYVRDILNQAQDRLRAVKQSNLGWFDQTVGSPMRHRKSNIPTLCSSCTWLTLPLKFKNEGLSAPFMVIGRDGKAISEKLVVPFQTVCISFKLTDLHHYLDL